MNNKSNSNDSRKITFVVVAILVLMLTTTGGTYAFLALSATATNNITGTVASASLTFSAGPSPVAPTGTYANLPLVPQYAYNNSKNVLQLAITGVKPAGGSAVVPCVDANGNAVCRVYSFTIKNNSTAAVIVKGTISFTNPSTNLRWAPMSSASSVADISSATDTDIHTASTTAVAFTDAAANTTWSLAANATKQFWAVFWINETGSSQNDSGTWYATIAFNSSNGKGVTSTITG